MNAKTFIISTDCPSGPKEILSPYYNEYMSKPGDIQNFYECVIKGLSLNNREKEYITELAFSSLNKYSPKKISTAYIDILNTYT